MRRATFRFSRSVHSRSMSRPIFSSKESWLSGGASSISRTALASVWSFNSVSFWIVSSMVMIFLLVKVARTAHELVRRGARCYGRSRWGGAGETALEDAFDAAAVWCTGAGDSESPKAGGVHALGAVLLSAAKDAERRAVAHLRVGIPSERAANDFFDVGPELGGPAEHALWRPAAVVL